MITAWHVRLACGKELHGRDIGSFANVKHRHDIIDLWVDTGAGKIYAARDNNLKHIGFDFYVHVSMEDTGIIGQIWKLITIYPDHKLIKYVAPDGRNYTELYNGI